MLRNPKLKDYGITVNGIEYVYVAFTRGEARAMLKAAHPELCVRTTADNHLRLPPHVVVRELKQLTVEPVSA